jgi:hypothetical protein
MKDHDHLPLDLLGVVVSLPVFLQQLRVFHLGWIASSSKIFAELSFSFLGLLLGGIGTHVELIHHPLPGLFDTLFDLSKDSLSWCSSSVFKKGILLTSSCSKLIDG